MTNIFRSSTHPTGLQQAIERATDSSQASEDWSLIMKICDYVNSHEESAKEAMKVIRKRLQINPLQQGWHTIGLILSLLEALTKNCGKIFHLQIAHKDFLKELKGVIGPKNNPPLAIQERVLSMIQNWALAFRNDPDLKNVQHFYSECVQHGLQFPSHEPEDIIKASLTPTRTIERPLQSTRSMPQQSYGTMGGQNRSASNDFSHSVSNNQTGAQSMSAEQIAKLRSELDIVQTNAEVFGEMLITLQPSDENPQDFELLMELHNTCKQMQARVIDLLSQITIDDITVDLLRYNDQFNNAFKQFENYMQERNRRFGSSQMPILNRTGTSPTRTNSMSQSPTNKTLSSSRDTDNVPALITFEDEPINNFQNMRINPTSQGVVPRNTQPQSTASTTTRAATNYQDPERDVREVEHWLKIQGDDPDNDEPLQQDDGTTAAFDNFLKKRASTIPDEPISEQQIRFNIQDPPRKTQKDSTYLLSINNPNKSPKYWPNLLIFFEPTKDLEKELIRKQIANSHYMQKNPWIHLMLSKRIDTAIDEFCCLCLRDHVYPWLSQITHDDSVVYEAKHVFRFFLATVIRRIQNVDINAFVLERLLPLIFQTYDRYIQTIKIQSPNESQCSIEFLKKIFKNDLHITMYNRQSELKYLKRLILDLMPIITPKFIYECKGSRHFLSELIACQILIDGIDAICQPNTLNRLFHLYFITAIQRRNSILNIISNSTDSSVELLTHFSTMNGPIHKNKLSLQLTDVMYEKELLSQFSRVLDRYGSIGLLSIYMTLSDLLNDIPSASNILVRKKIYRRLKHIDERYLNRKNSDGYVSICNLYDINDTLIDDIKLLIYNHLEQCVNDDNDENKSDKLNEKFDMQHTFSLLSKFHCKIYELVEEKYQRCFLTSDEHFLYMCGRRMDSPDYKIIEQNLDDNTLDFNHMEDIRNSNGNIKKSNVSRHYTTTSYKELEEKDEVNRRYPEDTTSISSNSSIDERDLNTWRIHICGIDELRDNMNSNTKYFAFIIEARRLDANSENSLNNDDERNHWFVLRRYQDFYLLEQKLIRFHGVFSDARLPPKRSTTFARNREFMESIKKEFEHFLRHLLSKPTLRNSELLYNFLTQPDDFTLPNGEDVLAKMFRVVPRRLRTEKGQYLDPFLVSLINYAEPVKPKATQPIPVFNDIIEEKLNNTIYGNNANIIDPIEEFTIEEKSMSHELDSAYDHLIVVAKQVFSASPLLIYLLDLLRIPLKNSFDTFFTQFIDDSVDDIINDEENIIDVIHALRDVVFPNDAEDKGPTDLVNFDDVVAAAEEFLPNVIKIVLGKSNVQNGLQMIFRYFQDPLLNKQLFYMILDEVLLQLFPELQAHFEKANIRLP
ncbi:unnamed protein product [Rotaria sp. Silwood1]|nr:unnamed protein product [Rotaria sp. Silwood1]